MVQRVSAARVSVAGQTVGEMDAGLLALVGVGHDDGPKDAESLARKLCELRVFPDASGRMNACLRDTGGSLAVVSQFTLMADVRKGRRPSFTDAAPADRAAPLIEAVVAAARAEGVPVVTGRFGAEMEVTLVNHGPVTLLVDTRGSF